MDNYEIIVESNVRIMKTTCKSCGKESIINNKELKGQIIVEDFVIKEQYCECCNCNFYEVEISTLFNLTNIKYNK